jgi:hypothetical protein
MLSRCASSPRSGFGGVVPARQHHVFASKRLPRTIYERWNTQVVRIQLELVRFIRPAIREKQLR